MSWRMSRGLVAAGVLAAVCMYSLVSLGGDGSNRTTECSAVRGAQYRKALRAALMAKYFERILECVGQADAGVAFRVRLGGRTRVQSLMSRSEAVSCVRRHVAELVTPLGVDLSLEFEFAEGWADDPHERVPIQTLREALGRNRLGWCNDDWDCLPDAICTCSSDLCSLGVGEDAGTRGQCVGLGSIACVRE